MRAGTLRNRVVILKPDDAASRVNGERTYYTYATVWAEILPMSGSESADEGTKKDQAEVTHKITMRYMRGVRPDMRMSFEGRIFKMQSVRDLDERNKEMEIMATEETDA